MHTRSQIAWLCHRFDPSCVFHILTRFLGETIAFLDSHCECVAGWLEPLLNAVQRDRKVVALPVADVLDQGKFFLHNQAALANWGPSICGFDYLRTHSH